MTKKKKTQEAEVPKQYAITGATLKDDICNYTYEILSGVGEGEVHNVKGSGIADDDLIDAFRAFDVHMACIDDVFKHSEIEINQIERMENHELTALYHVTGFAIKGGEGSETIELRGTKAITATGGRMEIKTQRIPIDSLSSYQWYNELKSAVDKARIEVGLYKEGKYTPVEKPEESDPKQMTIADAMEEDELENARV